MNMSILANVSLSTAQVQAAAVMACPNSPILMAIVDIILS